MIEDAQLKQCLSSISRLCYERLVARSSNHNHNLQFGISLFISHLTLNPSDFESLGRECLKIPGESNNLVRSTPTIILDYSLTLLYRRIAFKGFRSSAMAVR